MKPPAEIDHAEEHADLVFHQSNLKTVFSNAQARWKLFFPGWFSVSRSSTQPWSLECQYWEENAPWKILDGSAEKLRAELLAEKRDMIADPDGVRPEDLDDQMDGEMSLFFEKS